MAHNTFDKHNFSDKQIEDFRHAFEFFDKVSSYLIIDFAVETKQFNTSKSNTSESFTSLIVWPSCFVTKCDYLE